VRVIALLATYNERRFIDSCLEHLHEQGVESYLFDHGSTDNTIELAERWLGQGLMDIEAFPRREGDAFSLRAQMERKEELARELEADWFIHLDPDEIRLPPSRGQTLAQALEVADREGFNAVNFIEFTFTPTREEPDHDHREFQRTLHTYYPFARKFPHHIKAWKATETVQLASSGGHEARFPGLNLYPVSFPMKHYLFLSVPHVIEKYVQRHYAQNEIDSGWHVWRSKLSASDIFLPSVSEMRLAKPGADLDPSEPRTRHYLADRPETRF